MIFDPEGAEVNQFKSRSDIILDCVGSIAADTVRAKYTDNIDIQIYILQGIWSISFGIRWVQYANKQCRWLCLREEQDECNTATLHLTAQLFSCGARVKSHIRALMQFLVALFDKESDSQLTGREDRFAAAPPAAVAEYSQSTQR